MPATSHRQGVPQIVAAIQTAVGGVKLPDGRWGSVAPNLTPAFERVELFDSEQIVEAFRYLIITEQRVCVIVPMDEQFETITEKQKLLSRRMLQVMLLISDRVHGSRKAALWGDDVTPGALNLMELVLPAITGLVLPNPDGVIAEPVSSSVLSVGDTEKDLPSRVTVGLEFHCRGGYLQAGLPAGAIW